jgi:hypothetical protein
MAPTQLHIVLFITLQYTQPAPHAAEGLLHVTGRFAARQRKLWRTDGNFDRTTTV